MKALVKTKAGLGNLVIEEMPEPTLTDGQVMVEVKYTGICGTDLHIYHDTFKNYPPVILGHEFSGIVTDTSPSVNNVKVGDKVTVLGSTARTCGACSFCKTGYYMFCPSRRGMGHGVNGSFTKYVAVREDMVYKLSNNVPLEEAALAEPLACAVQAIEELTTIQVGDTVLLSGPGPIGLICLSLLALKGCKIIVAGTSADTLRLEIAKELGADIVIDVVKEDLAELIEIETNGIGVDVTIDCSGSGMAINDSFKMLKERGKHIQVGIVGKKVTLDYDQILYKQLQLFGSLAHSIKTWDKVIQILEQRKINLAPIITHKLSITKWEEAFKMCEDKTCGKVLLSHD